jgi:hypothetical protein
MSKGSIVQIESPRTKLTLMSKSKKDICLHNERLSNPSEVPQHLYIQCSVVNLEEPNMI